jgi:hypothetical protein
MNKINSESSWPDNGPYQPWKAENHAGHFDNMDKERLIGIIEKLIDRHYALEIKINPPDKDETRIMSEIYRDGNRLGYRVFY